MADNRVEYRFVLKGHYTPDNIPQKRLAQYLDALADLYGQDATLHFGGLAESSLVCKSWTDPETEDEIADRLESVHDEAAPAEIRKAYDDVSRMAAQDNATDAWIERQGARILDFPTGERLAEAVVYGPFWQRGHLSGTIILLGGKGDPVSVKIQTRDKAITCKATREIARSLRDYIWGQSVRVEGTGKWIRTEDGAWKLLAFDILGFDPIDDESLTTTVARLRAVEGKWKDRPDPISELEAIRDGKGKH